MLPKIGQTIELTRMDNDPDPIPVGTRGVVEGIFPVFDEYQIQVRWANGRRLSLIYPMDEFRIVEEKL